MLQPRHQHHQSVLSLTKSAFVLLSYLPALHSLPTRLIKRDDDRFPSEDPSSPAFWWKLGVSVLLVLLGGVFSGTFFVNPYLGNIYKDLESRTYIGFIESR
jgi:hypothetical protein